MALSNVEFDTVGTLFYKITSPLNKELDPNMIKTLCEKIDIEPNGHLVAIRLILHKIQSPSEVEAGFALDVLKTCAETCGKTFQQEIGKFRFLNELIKVLSPKYLGNQTSDSVKRKVVELFHCWTYTLPDEPKIAEAYRLLRKQGLIKEEPRFLFKSDSDSFSSKRRPKSIFDDEEKTKRIAVLLRSQNPDDINEANRLIKHLAFEDEMNTERLLKRKYELQRIRTNANLLSEMIENFDRTSTTKETLEVLYHELLNFTPLIHRLATETEDSDEGIGDILEVNDLVYRVIQQYKNAEPTLTVAPLSDSNTNAVHLIDLDKAEAHSISQDSEKHPVEETKSTEISVDAMLIDIFTSKETNSYSNENEKKHARESVACDTSFLEQNEAPSLISKISTPAYSNKSSTDVNGKDNGDPSLSIGKDQNVKGFDFLNEITNRMSAQLLLKSNNEKRNEKVECDNDSDLTHTQASLSENGASPCDEDLSNISINVAKFIPSKNPPIEVFKRSGLKVLAYESQDHPADLVYSLLFTAINSGEEHIKNLTISLISSKNIIVKSERPSSTELFPFNPVIPASCMTQGFLVKVDSKMDTKIKIKISYLSDEDEISDVREIILKYQS